uniref:glycosyltransferase family 2 protein n=1 Tax=Sphingomonas sp. TaxID=28214 RepID=UPI0025FE472C|nr:glycosyltransferase family 2 protein [Sphingomonas sp.]
MIKRASSSRPKVSICIPVYNGLPYIRSTLQSVLDQSFDDYEILIRDDRSDDGTFQWLQERYGQDPRFRLKQNSRNLNVGGQYNVLFSEARGDYILKLDSDDLLLPGMLAKLVSTADRTGADFVGSAYEWLDMATGARRQPGVQTRLPPGPLSDPVTTVLTDNPYSLCFSIWRRSLLPAIRKDGQFVLFTETCDWECQLRIALTGASFFTVKEVLGLYRLHATNRSAVINAQLASIIGDVVPYWWEMLRQKMDHKQLRRWLLEGLKGYLKAVARHPLAFSPSILAGYARLLIGSPLSPGWTLSETWLAELTSRRDTDLSE